MTPSGRATQAREALRQLPQKSFSYEHLIPEGAILLTAEEAEQVRASITDLLEMIALERGGGTPVVSEEYYARRDFARHVLNRVLAGGRSPA